MPVNHENIEKVKALLRSMPESYSQDTFGNHFECGTECCIAGYCCIAQSGMEEYIQRIKERDEAYSAFRRESFVSQTLRTARLFLGIRSGYGYSIFGSHSCWPKDLRAAYQEAVTPRERAEVACRALDRLQSDGSVRELNIIEKFVLKLKVWFS